MLKRVVLCGIPVLALSVSRRHGAPAEGRAAVADTLLLQTSPDGHPDHEHLNFGRLDVASLGRFGVTRPWRSRSTLARKNKEPEKKEKRFEEFDCRAHPYMCAAPFHCNKEPSDEELSRKQIATLDGHADLSAWCDSPYMDAARECTRRNMTGYASVMHRLQLKLSMGGRGIESMDAHYCFSFGHCDDAEVTQKTTLPDAEAMCDRRFGHDTWTNLTFDEAMGNLAFFPKGDLHLGADSSMYLGPKAEYAFAQMSCAMGTFHCDVLYCKQEYCSQPEFVEKYSHLRTSTRRSSLLGPGARGSRDAQ